ncbi:hypothetical protein ARMGADRAFT_1020815 [Armillaria gallica]|uniref:Uncharacterized protein n=1 Tax=Armillaria gallica TaxID=47427 RepID=A0A2H3CUU9_ARMGA|nr:hypothetical protein ARMGADRAFT_1020815 [Armillaria gallica]
MAHVLTQLSSRRGGTLGQAPTYTTTLPLGPFFSDADLFFRVRNSTMMSSSNINTVRGAIVSTLKQRTITFPRIARILSSFNASSSASGILRWIAELGEEVVVALKGIQVMHQ